MLSKPQSCNGCVLQDRGVGFTNPDGTGINGVLVVGEAPSIHDIQEGLPMRPHSPSGAIWHGILRRLSGVESNQFTIVNSIQCQPPSNWLDGAPYEKPATNYCTQYVDKAVREREPRVILALGSVAARSITGMSGYNQGIKLIRGYQLSAEGNEYIVNGKALPVIATYSPNFLLRASKTRSRDKEISGGKVEKAEGGMSLSGVMMRDVLQAIEIAKHGPLVRPVVKVIKGNREVMDELIRLYYAHPDWPVYWDIETPRSKSFADDESEIDSIQANVTQIQFGFNKEVGYVFPGFEAKYVMEGTREILSGCGNLNRRMFTWNGWKFDDKVVQGHHKIPILGQNIDLMSAWSWLQPDLPKGLQFATSFAAPEIGPWKHLVMCDEDTYGAYDVVSLAYNNEHIFKALDDRGLRNSYDRHVLMLRPEMVLASHRGFPVDKEKHEEFGTVIGKDIEAFASHIRALIPEDILGIEPKRKAKGSGFTEYGYVRTPKQLDPWLDDSGNPKDGTEFITISEEVPTFDDDGNPETEDDGTTPITETVSVVYTRRTVETQDKQTLEISRIKRWVRLIPFSLGSPDAKIRYIKYRREEEIKNRMEGKTLSWPNVVVPLEGFAGYVDSIPTRKSHNIKPQSAKDADRLAKYIVPRVKDKKKELKDNTGAKELEKLYKSTGDLVFRLLVDVGKLKKMYGTYYKGWRVVDGGVHTTFGLAATGTGQLSSVDPNIQNAPKHGDLAKVFRTCVAALPSKVLIEIDKKSFHAQTLALAARDKSYARLSALDVHSFMTAHRLKLLEAPNLLSWSDKDLGDWFTMMKKDEKTIYKDEAVPNIPNGLTFQQVRDYKSKKVILGIGFCQGAGSILDQNPEGYKNKAEVQTFLDLFGELFPDVKKFQQTITQLAHKQTHLISKWGYIRRFYDVFKWDSKKWNQMTGSLGDWTHGDDFEAAVAFLPANHAFSMIKEEMLRLAGYRVNKENPITMYEEYIKNKLILPHKEAENLMAKYGFVNQIHDSLIFHCDKSLADNCLEEVLSIMREKCLVLADSEMCPDGFFCDAEAMIGDNWASMKKVSV